MVCRFLGVWVRYRVCVGIVVLVSMCRLLLMILGRCLVKCRLNCFLVCLFVIMLMVCSMILWLLILKVWFMWVC